MSTDTDQLTTSDQALDETAAQWAEEEMTLPTNSRTALRGADAAAHGRAALEEALGGTEAVERAVRGRKTLGQQRPAGRSPKRQTTLPADLDEYSRSYIAAGGAKDFSALMREALTEFFDHHPVPTERGV